MSNLHDSTPSAGQPAVLDLPLRGLASTGAADVVGPALGALPGVLDVAVLAGEFRVRVTYDPARIAAEAIRERLHGLVPPDTAHGTPPRGDATGPTPPTRDGGAD